MNAFVFPPTVSHVKQAMLFLKRGTGHIMTKHWFLNRHAELVAQVSRSSDKRPTKASDPESIRTHFSRVQQARLKYGITGLAISPLWGVLGISNKIKKWHSMYNMDEMGLQPGIPGKAKNICVTGVGDDRQDGNRWPSTGAYCSANTLW